MNEHRALAERIDVARAEAIDWRRRTDNANVIHWLNLVVNGLSVAGAHLAAAGQTERTRPARGCYCLPANEEVTP